jgi:adenylate cyclase
MREFIKALLIMGLCNLLAALHGFGYGILTFLPAVNADEYRLIVRWMLLLVVATYVITPAILYPFFRPMIRLLDGTNSAEKELAFRRALNLPINVTLVSVGMWLLSAGSFLWFAHQFLWAETKSITLQITILVLLIGSVSSVFIFYALEAHTRRSIMPKFFGAGHIEQIRGALPIPIWLKLIALILVNGTLPIVVLASAAFVDNLTPLSIIYLAVSFLIVGGLQAWFIVNSLALPIRRLRREMTKLGQKDFSAQAPIDSIDDIGLLADRFNQTVKDLKQAEFVTETFGRYVSCEVRDEILNGKIALGGEERSVSVLFSDIRGFTPLSESKTPQELVVFLNRYLDTMVEAIVTHGGTIDKFIGDAIMAIFGAPLTSGDDARNAVRAGWEMLTRLRAFNSESAANGWPSIDIGIGVHSGPVIAGNVGSAKKMEYTVIGDTVNTASRIEQLNKQLRSRMLISAATHSLVEPSVETRRHGPVTVKGKSEAIYVYEVLGLYEK